MGSPSPSASVWRTSSGRDDAPRLPTTPPTAPTRVAALRASPTRKHQGTAAIPTMPTSSKRSATGVMPTSSPASATPSATEAMTPATSTGASAWRWRGAASRQRRHSVRPSKNTSTIPARLVSTSITFTAVSLFSIRRTLSGQSSQSWELKSVNRKDGITTSVATT